MMKSVAVAAVLAVVALQNAGSPMFMPVMSSLMTPMFRRMMDFTAGVAAKDCTQPEVAIKEEAAWKNVPGKDWKSYKKNRPYNMKSYQPKAPAAGSKAPNGAALTLDGKKTTLLDEVAFLGKATGSAYVAVSFDSATCPIWRTFAGADFHNTVSGYDVPVLHVYTREAHAEDEFATHVPPPVDLSEHISVHKCPSDRAAAAAKAKALLEVKSGESITMIMDSMSDKLERTYETRPFRLYIIEVATGKVAYAMGPNPFNIPAKLSDLNAFLKEAVGGLPWSFFFLRLMYFVHGFVLDICVICVLPFVNPKASDAERDDKFPWAKGGYAAFGLVHNLAPTHRRFMTENAAYAIVRFGPCLLYKSVPVLTLACVSYLVEAITIMWEIVTYDAPKRAMLPTTLMGVFGTQTLLTVTVNAGNTLKTVEPGLLTAMQVCVGLTWACWLVAAKKASGSKY